MKDPYQWMIECALNYPLHHYGTMIVAMELDGIRYNEILEFDANEASWIWLNDWYEGQKDIIFLGRILLEDVEVPRYEAVP